MAIFLGVKRFFSKGMSINIQFQVFDSQFDATILKYCKSVKYVFLGS